jgi:ABC-type multidrug transport system permease subunit
MVPAVILSGFATPIANMPRAVQIITYIDPLRYFLIILRKVFLEGAGFGLLLDQFWPLALIALGTLTLAALVVQAQDVLSLFLRPRKPSMLSRELAERSKHL